VIERCRKRAFYSPKHDSCVATKMAVGFEIIAFEHVFKSTEFFHK
jgi:hypothetical protein